MRKEKYQKRLKSMDDMMTKPGEEEKEKPKVNKWQLNFKNHYH